MFLTEDMRDLIVIFTRNSVKYTIVGGFAVNYYGYIRTTQDVDFLIFPSAENADKLQESLIEFGFGKAGIPYEYFTKEGTAVHIGVEPNRIDLLTKLSGISNTDIFRHIKQIEFEGLSINIISKRDLIKCKKASTRLKDLADAEELEKI